MDQHQFLQRVLPPLPTPDAFGNAPVYFSLGLGGQYPDSRPCSSVKAIINHCTSISMRGESAYMALFSFKNPLVGRKQENAYEVKSIWADLDVGPEPQKYQSFQEALEGLVKFVQATGLTPSLVVGSGMGAHVYWVFRKPVMVSVWTQIAGLFHQLCVQIGLKVDPTRARDAASVLRLPGTLHPKSGRTVTILRDNGPDWEPKDFVLRIGNQLTSVPALLPLPTAPLQTTANTLASYMGMGAQPPIAKAEPIVLGCPQMLTMGLGLYPQWFAGMSVLRRCVDGLEWAHKLSSMDPSRYDPAATEKKFYAAAEDAPARCSVFEFNNPEICRACSHKGQLKSPVQLHRMPIAQPAQAAAPMHAPVAPPITGDSALATLLGAAPTLNMPAKWEHPRIPINSPNFRVDSRGIIWVESKQDANKNWTTVEHIICRSQLYFKHSVLTFSEDMRPERSYVFEAVHPSGKTEDLLYVINDDSGLMNIMRWFNNGNMYATGPAFTGKVFMDFMNAYLASLAHSAKELESFSEFGWNTLTDPATKQKAVCFVTGAGAVTATGLHQIGFAKDTLKHAKEVFSHAGTLENWKFVPQMYKTLNQHIGQLAMCMAFAAPLMKYGSGDAQNAVLNIWSNVSGLGKSQVLRAAASVWGNPKESFFTREESVPARCRRLAIWNNIVACMDELTDVKSEDMYTLAYTLAGGKEKNKLRSSGDKFVDTGNWSTCTLATANKSFKEAIAKHAGDSEATLLRVMEYECVFPSFENQPSIQSYINACIAACRENYGLAGPEFVFRILQHPDRLATLTKQAEHWCDQNKFLNKERYMSYSLFLALKAGRWAVEFGLLDYDMDELERWVLEEFVPHNRMNTTTWAPDASNTLTTYLNSRQMHLLGVATEDRDPALMPDPKLPGLPDKYVTIRPLRETLLRYCQKERTMLFSKSDFDEWLRQRNISPLVITRQLAAEGIRLGLTRKNLGKDISWMPMPRIRCYILESADLDTLGYTIEATAVAAQSARQPIIVDLNQLNENT